MKKNVGNADRIIRILAAVAVGIFILTGTLTGTASLLLGIVAAVLLLTAFVGICPLYSLLKWSTKRAAPGK